MENFRIIRIAVTLSLIVTMATQPMVSAAVAGGCGDSECQHLSQPVCDGCGCCEVEHSEDLCCCCCGEKDASQSNCCDRAADSHGNSVATTGTKPTTIQGVCICGLTAPPMNRGSERDRAGEQVEVRTFAIAFVPPDDVAVSVKHAFAPVFLATTGKPPRFSQCFLCVWRL